MVRDLAYGSLPSYKGKKLSDTRITLQQFLKWSNVAQSGGEAKVLIQTGQVTVNGEVEVRRGRRLNAGDVIGMADGRTFEVSA